MGWGKLYMLLMESTKFKPDTSTSYKHGLRAIVRTRIMKQISSADELMANGAVSTILRHASSFATSGPPTTSGRSAHAAGT